jgi:hypothetical protein
MTLLKPTIRAFGGGHGHDDHSHDDHGHEDHGHDDHSHDGHGHDDHHHIDKADGAHKFLTAAASKRTMVFDGLKASSNHVFELDNIYRHHNDLPLVQ